MSFSYPSEILLTGTCWSLTVPLSYSERPADRLCDLTPPHQELAGVDCTNCVGDLTRYIMRGLNWEQKHSLLYLYYHCGRMKSCKSALPGCGLAIIYSKLWLFPWLCLVKVSVAPVDYYFIMLGQTSINIHQNVPICVPLWKETQKTQQLTALRMEVTGGLAA